MDIFSECGKEMVAVYADILRMDRKLKLLLDNPEHKLKLSRIRNNHNLEISRND